MLGKLFSTAASTLTPRSGTPNSSRPATSLESAQEDIHTRNLLFPDTETLLKHQHDQVFPLSSVAAHSSAARPFDLDNEIELELKDVRVIIMQEATAITQSATLLFDSSPPPELATDRAPTVAATPFAASREGRRSVSSPRKPSIGSISHVSRPVVITQEPTAPRAFGAFERKSSGLGRNVSYVETDGQRFLREYREEMGTFSNCIFGSSDTLAYKGTGTKVHIIPTDSKTCTNSALSPHGEGSGSFGRSSLRSSRLSQSYTSENVASGTNITVAHGMGAATRGAEGKKVLVTRIFPVPLIYNETEIPKTQTPTQQSTRSDDEASYPFPRVGDGSFGSEKIKPKQKRTPMYAIALVLQLPPAHHVPSAPASRSGFRGPGSYNEQESCSSSLNSSKWVMPHYGFGVDSLESSFTSEVDDNIDTITQHWDMIMRALSQLQATVSSIVLAKLKEADLASPGPRDHLAPKKAVGTVSSAGKRVEEDPRTFKLSKSNAKLLQLNANALSGESVIKADVDAARQRLVTGIKALQVVTGQGRWGIWREEARWVGKWAGGKEEGFFFFNLLTGFLGNHTEWLQALGPSWYRRRHYQQQRANRDDENGIPARTIIVSNDKMAARRLIFLLSAFLPSSPHPAAFRTPRPNTSASFGAYSQSPPSYLFPSREESLRRKINKRHGSGVRAVHSRTMSSPHSSKNAPNSQQQQQQQQSQQQQFLNSQSDRHAAIEGGSLSSPSPLKTANLPIPGSDATSRKSSATTTATVTPLTTTPHFSTRRAGRAGFSSVTATTITTGAVAASPTAGGTRPGSSGSIATDDLLRSLKRGDSAGHQSTASTDSLLGGGPNSSRWGSVISGFWSTTTNNNNNKLRRDSTNATDVTPPSEGGVVVEASSSSSYADRHHDHHRHQSGGGAGGSTGSSAPMSVISPSASKSKLSEMVEEAQKLSSSSAAAAGSMIGTRTADPLNSADNDQGFGYNTNDCTIPEEYAPKNISTSDDYHANFPTTAAPAPESSSSRISHASRAPPLQHHHQHGQHQHHPAGVFDSPVRTSINSADGVIDIDVPLPDFLSTSASLSSPSSSSADYLSARGGGGGFGSGFGAYYPPQGHGGFGHGGFGVNDSAHEHVTGVVSGNNHHGHQHMLSSADAAAAAATTDDNPLNVAGWLPRFHPDFALMALPAVEDARDRDAAMARLVDEVKAAMRREPTPGGNGGAAVLTLSGLLPEVAVAEDYSNSRSNNSHGGPTSTVVRERWVDVCSAVVADTTNFSIRRIRLKRLVRVRSVVPAVADSSPGATAVSDDSAAATASAGNATPGLSSLLDARSQYGNPYVGASVAVVGTSTAAVTPHLLSLGVPGSAVATTMTPSSKTGRPVERFVEEPIISMDETLIEAVERIIAEQDDRAAAGMAAATAATTTIPAQNRDVQGTRHQQTPKQPQRQGLSRASSRSTSRAVKTPAKTTATATTVTSPKTRKDRMKKPEAKKQSHAKSPAQVAPAKANVKTGGKGQAVDNDMHDDRKDNDNDDDDDDDDNDDDHHRELEQVAGDEQHGGTKRDGTATPASNSVSGEVPRSECKRLVLGALEEIVREVVEERKVAAEAAAAAAAASAAAAHGHDDNDISRKKSTDNNSKSNAGGDDNDDDGNGGPAPGDEWRWRWGKWRKSKDAAGGGSSNSGQRGGGAKKVEDEAENEEYNNDDDDADDVDADNDGGGNGKHRDNQDVVGKRGVGVPVAAVIATFAASSAAAGAATRRSGLLDEIPGEERRESVLREGVREWLDNVEEFA